MTARELLTQYAQVTEHLSDALGGQGEAYTDERLASVEAALTLRDELIEVIGGLKLTATDREDSSDVLLQIAQTEKLIEARIRALMEELQEKRTEVHEQRNGISLLKRANRSYIGQSNTSEGFFIDSKK